jgi:hypothetical protein
MKSIPFLTTLCLGLVMVWTPVPAQTPDDTDTDTAPPPPGSTVITSDELHSDQNTHVSVFTGNVITVGTNFTMTCQEMTVNFTKATRSTRSSRQAMWSSRNRIG